MAAGRTGMIAILLAIVGFAAPVRSQVYPAKPIHILMGYPAGTSLDVVTRHFAGQLQKMAGKPVLVENRVGAGGMIAMAALAKAAPDGYTIHFGTGASAASVQYKSLAFDPMKDVIPVASIIAFPFVLVVDPGRTSANTVDEFAAAMKRKGKVSYGAPNALSLVGGALFSEANGLSGIPVQYKSAADALRDIISGDLDFAFNDAGLAYGMIRQGKLKGLAVSMPQRSPNAPDLPTMTELGYKDFSFHGWMGVYTPAGVPPDIVAQLEKWVLEIANSNETAAFFKNIGADPFALPSAAFAAWEAREFEAWKVRAKIAKIDAN